MNHTKALRLPVWLGLVVLLAGYAVDVACAQDAEGVRTDGPLAAGDTAARLAAPMDHFDAASSPFDITVELGAPFDPDKPTVFLLADGQQFFVRPGAMAGLQERLFGDGFNVAGVIGRGAFYRQDGFLAAVQGPDGTVDWPAAWRLFRAAQWIEDVNLARRTLLGEDARILLFGRSGGGFLVHQYLARHGGHVARAFTSAPAVTPMSAFAGFALDSFWAELGAADPTAQTRLLAVLASGRFDRMEVARAFQRQNFFVPHQEIDAARLELLALFEAGPSPALEERLEAYQVRLVADFYDGPAAIPTRVRLYEFAQPFETAWTVSTGRLDPDIEVILSSAAPLIDTKAAGALTMDGDGFDRAALSRATDVEVFVLASRWDHVVDYRGALALAASYPRAAYWLADDNHTFHRMNQDGHYAGILRAFLSDGLDSQALTDALAAARGFHWDGD